MKKTEKAKDEEDDGGKHEVDDGVGESSKIKFFLQFFDGVFAPTLAQYQGYIMK